MDLFEFAACTVSVAKHAPQPKWEEPGTTLWGQAWLANVKRVCARYDTAIKFGERLLQTGRMHTCRIRGRHVQATFANREGGTVLVNLQIKALSPSQWHALEQICAQCGDDLFTSDDLPANALTSLFSPPDGLLAQGKEISSSCSHCTLPFCLYRAATLLAVAVELDQCPIKLFELRGATHTFMLTHAAQQTWDSDDQIPETDLPSIFGVELVE